MIIIYISILELFLIHTVYIRLQTQECLSMVESFNVGQNVKYVSTLRTCWLITCECTSVYYVRISLVIHCLSQLLKPQESL